MMMMKPKSLSEQRRQQQQRKGIFFLLLLLLPQNLFLFNIYSFVLYNHSFMFDFRSFFVLLIVCLYCFFFFFWLGFIPHPTVNEMMKILLIQTEFDVKKIGEKNRNQHLFYNSSSQEKNSVDFVSVFLPSKQYT